MGAGQSEVASSAGFGLTPEQPPARHLLRRAIKDVHAVMARLRLHLHNTKRCIGKLSNGFDFLGYRVVPGRKLRTSAEGRRRFAEKFRRLYEQGADHRRLWRYAERWCRWRGAGLDGLVSLKGEDCEGL